MLIVKELLQNQPQESSKAVVFIGSTNGMLISRDEVKIKLSSFMETKTKSVSQQLQFNQGNPDSPSVKGRETDEDLNEEENQATIAEEEDAERKQIAEEQREREIEKSYEEEDESNKKDWARF